VSVIAIIPARGGSKRLPRKNVVSFLGEPIIAYSIRAALASDCFSSVLVSTEDPEIEHVAREAGAEVVQRPVDLASDTAGVVDVCVQVLGSIADRPKWFCCLYPTAPLRSAADIRQTLEIVISCRSQFAMAVTDFDLPAHQALSLGDDGSAEPMMPELASLQGQAAPEIVVDNGSTYAADVDAFLRQRSFYGPGLCVHRMPRWRSVDIDT